MGRIRGLSRMAGAALGVGSFLAASAATYALLQDAPNPPGQYRLPIPAGEEWTITQGQDNGGNHPLDSHKQTRGIGYAVDLARVVNAPVTAARAGIMTCEDWRLSGTRLGWVIRVVHDDDSEIYAHADHCPLSDPAASIPVVQGEHLTYTGSSGTDRFDFGDHLHFQRNASRDGLNSAPFAFAELDGLADEAVANKPVVGQSSAAGYSEATPVVVDEDFRRAALSFGWETLGTAFGLEKATPGRSASSLCGSGPAAGWFGCEFRDVNGTARAGRIQTFWNGKVGEGERALMKAANAENPFLASRALLVPLAEAWDADGHDGLYFLGYPTGEASERDGVVEVEFDNGYMRWRPAECKEKPAEFWWYSELTGAWASHHGTAACD